MKRLPAILFALFLALTCRAGAFDFSAPNAAGHGTEAVSAILADTAADAADKPNATPATFALTNQTIVSSDPAGASVTSSTYQSTPGKVAITCLTQKTPAGYSFMFTITNGLAYRLDQVDIRLPEISTAADPANKIMSPFRGGSVVTWATDWQQGQGNSSLWPGTAFSPISTAWNDRTGDTLAITFFNKALVPVFVYWFSGGDGQRQYLNPFLRCFPRLQPGQSVSIGAEYRVTTGGPLAHAKYYRENVLAPFMKELSIPEAKSTLGPGPIAMTATGADQFTASADAAQAAGACAYIQWAAPDGLAAYYNPYPPQFEWFNSLGKPRTSTIPIGVLINPFISPRVPADKIALINPSGPLTNLHINVGADDVRLSLARLRDALATRGVTIAFWDTGSGPDGCSGHEWLKLLASWKAAGVAIMPETSCDLAAWTTGLWMEFPYSWGTYAVPRAVTPGADLCSHTNFVDIKNGVDWKQDARSKGVRPIITVEEVSK